MVKKIIKKLAILMFLQGALGEEQHEHVHVEQPEWETIEDSAVSISGAPVLGSRSTWRTVNDRPLYLNAFRTLFLTCSKAVKA